MMDGCSGGNETEEDRGRKIINNPVHVYRCLPPSPGTYLCVIRFFLCTARSYMLK